MAANQERDFHQEAARLLAAASSGTLATLADGLPHAALVTPALNADGTILLLLSELSSHTRHLRANPACALLVTGPPPGENPQTAPRLLVSGIAEPSAAAADAESYLQKHPYADLYFRFTDFSFWRLIAKDAHYVGGFAAAAHLELDALQQEIIRFRDDVSG